MIANMAYRKDTIPEVGGGVAVDLIKEILVGPETKTKIFSHRLFASE